MSSTDQPHNDNHHRFKDVITTRRLLLRPWQRSDLYAMVEWPRFPDPIDDEWNWPHILREQGTLDLFWISRSQDARRLNWTICLHTGTIVGYVNIRDIDDTTHSAALGIGFGYPFVGQGYGTEALQGFLDYYFDVLKFAVLGLEVAIHNERACRLYHRLGFVEGRTFWHQAELPLDWSFLEEPRYAMVRHLFRRGQHAMYIQCMEMELRAEVWKQRTR